MRIEAADDEGALARTIKLIKDSTSLIEILQYSLRAKDSKAIMEFALSITAKAKLENTNQADILEIVFRKLKASDEIKLVREINEVSSTDRSSQKRTLSI